MGTRSLTTVQDERGFEIAVLYRHYDGYLSGHGTELAQFLNGIEVVNGIPLGTDRRIANGMEDLAAMIVAHFKNTEEAGQFYLHRAGTRDIGEEYIYVVRLDNHSNGIVIEVHDVYQGTFATYEPRALVPLD